MGLPVIDITFEQMAKSALARSGKGVVALLLCDATADEPVTSYGALNDVNESAWTRDNAVYITTAFKSGADRVLAERVLKTGAEGSEKDDFEATLSIISAMEWNWLAAPDAQPEDVAKIAAWIKARRAEKKLFKAVVGGADAPDCEGVVNLTTTGIVSSYYGSAPVTPQRYSPRIAGLLAGLSLDRSCTGCAVPDIVEADAHLNPDGDIDAGKLVIVNNGTGYEIGRGVTSLINADGADPRPDLFKKIKHVEGVDMIAHDMAQIFKKGYRGKCVNSYANKQNLVGEYLAYFKGISGSVLSPDYKHSAMVDFERQRDYLIERGVNVDGMSDIDILKADTGENVFIRANIRLIDAMEDVYISVEMN